MASVYRFLIPLLWLAWAAYWWAASRNVKLATRSESLQSRLLHIVPLALAVALIALPRLPLPVLGERFLPHTLWPFWAGALLTLAGLVFTVWGRVHLGGNWSGIVTVKEGHELVASGPYRLVRHPIYAGLLLAFFGSALARAEWRGVIAVALVLGAFARKIRIEERWMCETFGEQYLAYRERVAALVPFVL